MPQLITPGNLRGGGNARQSAPPAQIVDVGKEPSLKSAFLSGRISNLAAPFIYHDPAKEIAYVLTPMELNMREADQQRIIGQLTQSVMRGLPENAPRAYLLQPRTFFTMQSLVEAILEKDGITPEMLKAQQEKSDLLRDLLRSTDEDSQRATIAANEAKFDAAAFELLSLNLDAAAQAGREDVYQRLIALEKLLVEGTAYGKKVGLRAQTLETLQKTPTRENLLALLIGADEPETREMLIAMGRQLLDYAFFQQLSGRIDAAPSEDARQHLIALRKEVQETRLKIEQAQREVMQHKAGLINRILTSDKPLETAQALAEEIDDTFMGVLEANVQQAQQQGQSPDLLRALQGVQQIATQIMSERQPPEVQIANALLAAQYPDETGKILEDMKDMTDDRFVRFLGQFAEQLAQQDRSDLSAKLTQIMIQARSILPTYDPAEEEARRREMEQTAGGPPPAAPAPPKPTIEIARR